MKSILDFLKKQPLLTAVLGILVGVGGIKLLDAEGDFAAGVQRLILALAMGVFLYLISGEKTPEKCCKTTGYVIKSSIPLLILPGLLGIAGLAVNIYKSPGLKSNWPIALITLAFEMLCVGLFEEMLFRAVVNDGIVYQFRSLKRVFLLSAVLGSLIFGWVHVMSADISEPSLLAQAILKTVSTGLMGLALLFMYWKTRNIWGCAIVHAIFDFMPTLGNAIFEDNGIKQVEGYVIDGQLGQVAIWFYIIETVINLIFLIVIWNKTIKKIDFEELRQTW